MTESIKSLVMPPLSRAASEARSKANRTQDDLIRNLHNDFPEMPRQNPSAPPGPPGVQYLLSALQYLKSNRKFYLDQDDLYRMRVKLTNLDIHTGVPDDHGQQFLQLSGLKQTKEVADKYKLKDYRGLEDEFEHDGVDGTNVGEAGWMSSCFSSCLELDEMNQGLEQRRQPPLPSLLDQRGWSQRM